MDPLTHGILGAAIGYAVGGRRFGRHAAAIGALAGMTPDIDHFVSSTEDPLLYVEFHRYFTHSIFFALIGAFVPMVPWLLREEFRAQWRQLWLCAWPAYLSHCFLDASTTYGTQLFWPFTRMRVGWDLIAIVDPLFTLGLAAALVAALVRRRRNAALSGIAFALAYIAIGAVQHGRAAAVQVRLAASRGHTIDRAEVMPTLANNVVWRSVYLTGDTIHSDRIRVGWFSRGTVREGTSLPAITREQLLPHERDSERTRRGFERFAWFSGGWLARAPDDDTIIGDMRYSRSIDAFDPIWGIRLTNVAGQGRVEWLSRERERRLSPADLWAEISGKDARFEPPEAPTH